ncbi:MAG: DUF4292 domain-containing protein [Chitinophagaceae bacterium]
MKYIMPFLIALNVILAIGCRPTKKIQTAIAKKDTAQVVIVDDSKADSIKFIHEVLGQVRSSKIDFKTFSAKIKVDYSDKDGKGPDLTVFVRMLKDSAIWLSINATVFSYEAFRVIITPDSVKVLNKKDKQVQLRSVNYLQELVQIPFDFKTLQDLIIGNPIYLDSNIVSFKKTESSLLFLSMGNLFKNLLTLSNEGYVLEHSKLDDVNTKRNRTCDLTYSNYENKSGVSFSTLRKITVAEKSKVDVDMDFKQYSFNEILSLPFTIPKNYKRS